MKQTDELLDFFKEVVSGLMAEPEMAKLSASVRKISGEPILKAEVERIDYPRLIGRAGKNFSHISCLMSKASENITGKGCLVVVPSPPGEDKVPPAPFVQSKSWRDSRLSRLVAMLKKHVIVGAEVELEDAGDITIIEIREQEKSKNELRAAVEFILHSHGKNNGRYIRVGFVD